MAKTIYRSFDNNEQVGEFILELCSKYESVELRTAPVFSESGQYSWNVDEPFDPSDTIKVHG